LTCKRSLVQIQYHHYKDLRDFSTHMIGAQKAICAYLGQKSLPKPRMIWQLGLLPLLWRQKIQVLTGSQEIDLSVPVGHGAVGVAYQRPDYRPGRLPLPAARLRVLAAGRETVAWNRPLKSGSDYGCLNSLTISGTFIGGRSNCTEFLTGPWIQNYFFRCGFTVSTIALLFLRWASLYCAILASIPLLPPPERLLPNPFKAN